MKKLMVLGAICLSATILLAQTQKKQIEKAPPPNAASNVAPPKLIPLNIKLGQWQSTTTMSVTGALGLPPDMVAKMTAEQRARYEAAMKAEGSGTPRTITDKGCITADDLTRNPFQQRDPEGRIQCHGTLLNSTSSDITLQETCSGEASMTYTMKIHATDQEHTTGTGQGTATMGGKTMNSNFTFNSTWIGATCPTQSN